MDANWLVRADAVVECGLGAVLLALGASGGGDFPHVPRAIVLAAGAFLVMLGALIWLGRFGLRTLAQGNAVTALAAIAWFATASGFSSVGAAVLGATVASLALLAAAQFAADPL